MFALKNTSVLFSALEFTQNVHSRGKLDRFYNQDSIRKKILDITSTITAAQEAFMVCFFASHDLNWCAGPWLIVSQVKIALIGHESNTRTQDIATDTRDMVNRIQDVVRASADDIMRLQDDDDVCILLIDLVTFQ